MTTIKDFELGTGRLTIKEIDELSKELREERTKASFRDQCDNHAKLIFQLYQSYIEAGFTAEQAWVLITSLANKA